MFTGVGIFVLIFTGQQLYNHPTTFEFSRKISTPNLKPNGTKLILYWTDAWGRSDFAIGFGSKPFQQCSYRNCYATDNRELFPLETYDALLFHGWHTNVTRGGISWTRSPNQKYVIMHREPPPLSKVDALKSYGIHMNWTMTYRFDSDLAVRHGFVVRSEQKRYRMPNARTFQRKSRMIAWFVSHCETDSHREDLVKEMMKYVPVDVFGQCGTLYCEKDQGNKKLSSKVRRISDPAQ